MMRVLSFLLNLSLATAGRWIQNDKVVGAGVFASEVGYDVDIEGDLMVAGAPSYQEEDFIFTGGVVFFRINRGRRWEETNVLVPRGAEDGDQIGLCVAMSGNLAVAGSPGGNKAYVFSWNPTRRQFADQATVTGDDTTNLDDFGASIDLVGTTMIVGAPRTNGGVGAAYIFEQRENTPNWFQKSKIVPNDQEEGGNNFFSFGSGVALNHNASSCAVGAKAAIGPDPEVSGAVYIFDKDFTEEEDNWNFVQKIYSAEGLDTDEFGQSVEYGKNFIIVGAPGWGGVDGSGDSTGAAYVFQRNATTGEWYETQRLLASDGGAGFVFGTSMSLDSNEQTLVIGSPRAAQGAPESGAVYIFQLKGDTYSFDDTLSPRNDRAVLGVRGYFATAEAFMGEGVGVSNGLVAVGSWGESTRRVEKVGVVRVFENRCRLWQFFCFIFH